MRTKKTCSEYSLPVIGLYQHGTLICVREPRFSRYSMKITELRAWTGIQPRNGIWKEGQRIYQCTLKVRLKAREWSAGVSSLKQESDLSAVYKSSSSIAMKEKALKEIQAEWQLKLTSLLRNSKYLLVHIPIQHEHDKFIFLDFQDFCKKDAYHYEAGFCDYRASVRGI